MQNLKFEILPEQETKIDISFKVIIIGDCGVGRSSLSLKATKNIFTETYKTTIGFEFYTFNIKINNLNINLQIWDTCGQETFKSLISNFYKNSSLAIIVYAIDNINSFNNINMWIKDLKQFSNPNIKIILIGNKNDLNDKRVIQFEKGKEFSKDYNFDLFFETSAKNGFNVKNVFIDAAKILYLEYMEYVNIKTNLIKEKKIVIHKKENGNEDERNKKKCCL
jgi:small GTP-binding protein